MKEGWWERKRESKCVHRKKAKRQQKSNSLTSVWNAVVASEGQRGEINTSWFAEGGWVGGGEERRERDEKKDRQHRYKNTDSTQERKIKHEWDKMFICVVLHTGARRSLTGEAGIFRSCRWVSERGGSYLSGRADWERAARERCEEADESCPASPCWENAWEDARAENCTEQNRHQGFNMTSDTFASNSYKAIQTKKQLLNTHDDMIMTHCPQYIAFFKSVLIISFLIKPC